MDKEQIICKYKFQNKEKFDGKPYCTCFCELCEDLPICVHNCQIFEDYKQLQKEKFENLNNRQIVEDAENLIYENSELYKNLKEKEQECEQIKEKYEALKLENQEGYEIVDELKHECEELKKTVLTKCPNCNSEYLTPKGIELYEENQNLKQECEELKKANVLIDNNRECKAIKLMEIEKLIISCMSGYTDKFTQEIMDIIRKPETVCFENKYEQALDTVSEYIKDNCYSCQGIKYGGCEKCELKRIKEIISKAKDGNNV